MVPPVPKCCVLVVDDNIDAAESLSRFLVLLGHEVLRTETPPSLLARSMRPKFVFLDIGLPGYDGFQVAEILRREPALASVKIIAITGHGREEDRQQSLAAGIDYQLVKPIDLNFIESLIGNATATPLPPRLRTDS
jgi:CheY-like chemotaxis protein